GLRVPRPRRSGAALSRQASQSGLVVRATTLAGVSRNRALVAIAVVAGIVLVALAILYWAEPAKSLPSFLPGHEAGSNHHHVKHGIAAFLVGLAWFNTGGPRTRTAP